MRAFTQIDRRSRSSLQLLPKILRVLPLGSIDTQLGRYSICRVTNRLGRNISAEVGAAGALTLLQYEDEPAVLVLNPEGIHPMHPLDLWLHFVARAEGMVSPQVKAC